MASRTRRSPLSGPRRGQRGVFSARPRRDRHAPRGRCLRRSRHGAPEGSFVAPPRASSSGQALAARSAAIAGSAPGTDLAATLRNGSTADGERPRPRSHLCLFPPSRRAAAAARQRWLGSRIAPRVAADPPPRPSGSGSPHLPAKTLRHCAHMEGVRGTPPRHIVRGDGGGRGGRGRAQRVGRWQSLFCVFCFASAHGSGAAAVPCYVGAGRREEGGGWR